MKRYLGTLAALAVALLLVLAAVACRPEKSYRAERLDVDVLVHDDGAATITETVTFAFRGAPFTFASREIPTGQTDGVDRLAVYEEGQAYSPGQEADHYQVQPRGDSVRVTWHFSPTENAARTFVVAYRVKGLIRQEGPQDVLRWPAVPSPHSYGLTQAQVVVRLPDQVGPLNGARVLEGHAQAGILGRQVSFLANEIEPDEPLVLGIWFPHGQLQGVPPSWQQRELAQAARSPIWIALAALILAPGLIGAVWAWRRFGRERVAAITGPLAAPPGDLAPGLAGALLHNGATLADAAATLIDLGRRGAVAVEETNASGRGRRAQHFSFRLKALPPNLRPFEELSLQLAFARVLPTERPERRKERVSAPQPDRGALERLVAEGGAVSLGDLASRLQANRRTLARQYNAELYELELLGVARDRIRHRLFGGGMAAWVLAALSIAVPLVWGALYGPWPLLLTAALFSLGAVVLAAAATASRRTKAGEQAAGEWRAFRRYLQQLARSRSQPDKAELFEPYLAYALAFGLGERWARQMTAAGAAVPGWFHAPGRDVDAAAQAAAFVALMAALSASGSGAAAANGGASGAG